MATPLIATDAKEFKRPKLERGESGELVRGADGHPIVVDSRGFYTQLGCTLSFPDPEAFRKKFVSTFKECADRYKVDIPRQYVSSRVLLEQVFKSNLSATLSFLYRVLEGTKQLIDQAHIAWVILPQARTPTIRVGGVGSASVETPTRDFVSAVGNMFPPICAWHYYRNRGSQRLPEVRLDHFQGKTNRAWNELVTGTGKITIIPWGDECDPFICMSDIFCYLTDKRLGQNRLQLRPESITQVWSELPFPVKGFFMDERFLGEIGWTDQQPLRIHSFYPKPMTYLMIDNELIEGSAGTPDRLTYRAFLEGRGYVHAVVLHAQLNQGGFKVYSPDDWSEIRDGDHLVYMGTKSEEKARTLSYAVDVTRESVTDLRKRLRERGFNC
jgi:hypothetical protein